MAEELGYVDDEERLAAGAKGDVVEGEGFVSGPLLTVSQAAKHLGVAKRIIYQLIEYGQVTAVKVKGSVRIEQKSLDEYRSRGGMG